MARYNQIDAFNDCIDRLQAGQTMDDCLRAHPDHAAWLRPALETGLAVARANPAVPPAARARVRARVLQASAVQPRQRFGFRSRLMAAAMLAAAVGLIALLFWQPEQKRLHVVPLSPTVIETATPTATTSPAASHTPQPTHTPRPSWTSTHTSSPTPQPTHTPRPTWTLTHTAAPVIDPGQPLIPTDAPPPDDHSGSGNSGSENSGPSENSGSGSSDDSGSDHSEDDSGHDGSDDHSSSDEGDD